MSDLILEQVKQAVDNNYCVYWSNKGYQVIKDRLGRYLIKHHSGNVVGLCEHDIGCIIMPDIAMWREPTKWELKFGEGAIHYKSLPYHVAVNLLTGKEKHWCKCPVDGLRYNRFK